MTDVYKTQGSIGVFHIFVVDVMGREVDQMMVCNSECLTLPMHARCRLNVHSIYSPQSTQESLGKHSLWKPDVRMSGFGKWNP